MMRRHRTAHPKSLPSYNTEDEKKPTKKRRSFLAFLVFSCILALLVFVPRSIPQPIQDIRRLKPTKITADVHGNLGPPSVMNQNKSDWLKDRWQAASDMHGTAIRGAHWVELQFDADVVPQFVVLDWETALSTDYAIQGRILQNWTTIFDSKMHTYNTSSFGQSPGVKQKLPLHILHNCTIQETIATNDLRVWIRSSDRGWGVSLWQVQVFGQPG